MRILNPNTGDKVQYVVQNNIFVMITDFGDLFILTNIRVKFDKESGWYWIPIHRKRENVVGFIEEFSPTFNKAINRKVNDPYCTVYEFGNTKEFLENAGKIKYVDNIQTIYEALGPEDSSE